MDEKNGQSDLRKKKTLRDLLQMKDKSERVSFITAYEYQIARLAEQAGIDMILVGDSAGNNMLGFKDTRPVTMDQMIMLAQAVRRGAQNTFVIGDMPLGSYQSSDVCAIDNALRFIKEAEMDAVKCEGGKRMAGRIRAMSDAGIAVMGHIGYTPQSTNLVGVVQGNDVKKFEYLAQDAQALQDAGAFAILLEAVPNDPAKIIAKHMKIPIYGIGAGRDTDGVLAIVNDVIGLGDFTSKFVKRFCEAGETIKRGIESYAEAVRSGAFPMEKQIYPLKDAEREAIENYAREFLK